MASIFPAVSIDDLYALIIISSCDLALLVSTQIAKKLSISGPSLRGGCLSLTLVLTSFSGTSLYDFLCRWLLGRHRCPGCHVCLMQSSGWPKLMRLVLCVWGSDGVL